MPIHKKCSTPAWSLPLTEEELHLPGHPGWLAEDQDPGGEPVQPVHRVQGLQPVLLQINSNIHVCSASYRVKAGSPFWVLVRILNLNTALQVLAVDSVKIIWFRSALRLQPWFRNWLQSEPDPQRIRTWIQNHYKLWYEQKNCEKVR